MARRLRNESGGDVMTVAEREKLKERIRVYPGFVAKNLCREILSRVDPAALRDATIADGNQPTAPRRVDKTVRNVMVHDCLPVESQVNRTVQRIVDELIEPFYDLQIDYWERPDVLVYPPGGFYRAHNDGEAVEHDAVAYEWRWRRSMDRDISVVWYLNEDFDGGGLWFPRFQYLIRPQAGMIVTFPSTHEFAHMAQPVTSGMRYAVVTWMAAIGTPRLFPAAPRFVRNRSWRHESTIASMASR
jgi:predicted 2-oxoglutarate/Fe(II)-dependent dioxygenase YbiX